jgi:GNAT superfamily N-acetyltransferase
MGAAWGIERFDATQHDRGDFDCGKPSLNAWLSDFASQYERKNLARTYVATLQGEHVVRGYYSVASHHVLYETLPQEQAKGLARRQACPVVLLGKLAVCKSVQGQGLGKLLLLDALRLAEHVSSEIGARAVEVDAIDDNAQRFYLKFGFVQLRDNPFHLYLSMMTVKQMRLPPWRPR